VSTFESGSLEEVAFAVCTAMSNSGVTAVLTGGGAAAFYAPAAYVTHDLDFVLPLAFSGTSATPILELGFTPSSARGMYRHPETPLTLEFLDGPLAVGGDIISAWETVTREAALLYVITPTDSVRDRLAAGIHWNDPNASRQAAEVAKVQPVNLVEVEEWCRLEGGDRVFELFRQFLAGS
jgi:hypothetical protein